MDHPTTALTLQILAAVLKVLHHGRPGNRFPQRDLIPIIQDALGNARRSYAEVAAVLRCAVDSGFLTSSESNDTTYYQLPVDTQAVPQTPPPNTTPRDLWKHVHVILSNMDGSLDRDEIFDRLHHSIGTSHHQVQLTLEWAYREQLVDILYRASRVEEDRYALTKKGRSWNDNIVTSKAPPLPDAKPVDTTTTPTPPPPVHDICGIPHATWALFDSVRYPGESAVATIERLLAKHSGAPGKIVEPAKRSIPEEDWDDADVALKPVPACCASAPPGVIHECLDDHPSAVDQDPALPTIFILDPERAEVVKRTLAAFEDYRKCKEPK